VTDPRQTIAERRKYAVVDTEAAKAAASVWLARADLENAIAFGLPEVDDRYHIWRVPLLARGNGERVGEVVIDARTSLIIESKSTAPAALEARLLGRSENGQRAREHTRRTYPLSDLRNTIAAGDCETVLQELPAESVDLIFTSPPYYNARPEYADYLTYESYLHKLRRVIHQAHRVLAEGRFFVMNIAPVLIRRASRGEASRRLAVPFDVHRLFTDERFDFVEDIIWEKPEGAGWATGRGRRFAADRTPLQYKAVPVTEYVLVYRKHTSRLIDWNIRAHPDQTLVNESRIEGEYDRTNIWRISPEHDRRHPAVFPLALAEKVIRYYSFRQDVVLDPFAGIGTTGKAAVRLGRRFVLIEQDADYVDIIRQEAKIWMGRDARHVLTLNCPPIDVDDTLF
jgi:DNA modification methylase